MPVESCQSENKPGFRWGGQGHCYTYTPGNEQSREAAHEKAAAQGRAIKARGADMEHTEEFQEELAAPTYAMVALIPTPDEAAALALNVEGAEPAESLHVTLVYLGPEATATLDRMTVDAVAAEVASQFGPLSGIYNGTAYFGPETEGRSPAEEGTYPLVATLDMPGLDELRAVLCMALRSHADFPPDTHGFVPHLTRAYLAEPPSEMPPPPMLETSVTEIAVCWGDYVASPENVTLIPLGGMAAVEVVAEPEPVEQVPTEGMTARERRARSVDPARDPSLPSNVRAQFQQAPPPAMSSEPQWKSLVVWEGKETVDFRSIEPGVLQTRDQEQLPGMWTDKTTENHEDAERALTLTRLWKDNDGWRAEGVYVDNEAGRELQRQTNAGTPYWPSVDIGGKVSIYEIDEQGVEHERILAGVIAGFTVLSMQAQDGTWFLPIDATEPAMPEPAVPLEGEAPEEAPALVAAATPAHPPAAWFDVPAEVDHEQPIVVTDEGRIFGNIAGTGCHVGLGGCTLVPAHVDYSMFNDSRGSIRTAEGFDVRVGPVTLVGGHAPIRQDRPLGYQAAVQHYDDTASTVAYGRVGSTRVGNRILPWFSGVLRPTATDEQVHTLRAHGVSGDWRPLNGKTTLAAVLSVPVPGFPVRPKAMVAAGRLTALITSSPLPEEEEEDMDEQKLADLHRRWHEAQADPQSEMAADTDGKPEAPDGEEEEETEEQRFARLHQQAHADLAAETDGGAGGADDPRGAAFAATWATFQGGNVQALIDHACSTYGSMSDCMEEAGQHADDPGALCGWLQQQCGGEFGAQTTEDAPPEPTPAELAASLAVDALKAKFYAPSVASLRERVGAAVE